MHITQVLRSEPARYAIRPVPGLDTDLKITPGTRPPNITLGLGKVSATGFGFVYRFASGGG